MILIADSGSTKTTWALLRSGKECSRFTDQGINPFLLNTQEIQNILQASFSHKLTEGVEAVFFYGAGCRDSGLIKMQQLLQAFFNCDRVEVQSDLLGAARASCGNKPGILGILGTGSNSCYYDGKQIVDNVPALGYVLGDEGSGTALGKALLKGIFKRGLPPSIRDLFFEHYALSQEELLLQVYKKPFPNRYLAGFTYFLSEYKHLPEIQKLVKEEFYTFFIHNLLPYAEFNRVPLYFVGSIAQVFQESLYELAQENKWTIQGIEKEPINQLITYHSKSQNYA